MGSISGKNVFFFLFFPIFSFATLSQDIGVAISETENAMCVGGKRERGGDRRGKRRGRGRGGEKERERALWHAAVVADPLFPWTSRPVESSFLAINDVMRILHVVMNFLIPSPQHVTCFFPSRRPHV